MATERFIRIFAAAFAAALAVPCGAQAPADRSVAAIRGLAPRPAPPAPASSADLAVPEPSAAPAADASDVLAGAIQVDGGEMLDTSLLMQAIGSFVGHRLSATDQRDLLAAVSGVARAQGLVFARSSIPPQALVGGVLHVRLDPGRIDRIELVGTPNRLVATVLAPLVGQPARRNILERRLLLAGDVPGIAIGHASYERRGDAGVLIVEVQRVTSGGHAAIDNRGSSELGPIRAEIDYDIAGLLGAERLSAAVGVLVTPISPSEVAVGTARIAYELGSDGSQLALAGSYGHTHAGGRLAGADLTGAAYGAGLAFERPLLRSRRTSLWLSASLDLAANDQWSAGTRVQRDRTASLVLGLNGYLPLAGGRLRGGVALARSLALPGTTATGDPLASRPGASDRATILSGWANWQGTLAGPVSAAAAFSGQLSSAPLFVGEQIGIGGPEFGRAYDYGEETGDDGALGAIELQLNVPDRGPLRAVQLYGFADAAYVANHDSAIGTGDLFSAGVGARALLAERVRSGVEVAFPVNAPRYDTGNFSPRVSFTLGSDF